MTSDNDKRRAIVHGAQKIIAFGKDEALLRFGEMPYRPGEPLWLVGRADRFAEVRAGTITEYRRLAGKPDEPRILLLVDGITTFRETYEFKGRERHFELFQQIGGIPG